MPYFRAEHPDPTPEFETIRAREKERIITHEIDTTYKEEYAGGLRLQHGEMTI
jgi:hypothetical protein